MCELYLKVKFVIEAVYKCHLSKKFQMLLPPEDVVARIIMSLSFLIPILYLMSVLIAFVENHPQL